MSLSATAAARAIHALAMAVEGATATMPFVPLVVTARGGAGDVRWFKWDPFDDPVDDACPFVRIAMLDAGDAVPLVRDGFLAGPDGTFDALLSKVIDSVSSRVVLGQRCRVGRRPSDIDRRELGRG